MVCDGGKVTLHNPSAAVTTGVQASRDMFPCPQADGVNCLPSLQGPS